MSKKKVKIDFEIPVKPKAPRAKPEAEGIDERRHQRVRKQIIKPRRKS